MSPNTNSNWPLRASQPIPPFYPSTYSSNGFLYDIPLGSPTSFERTEAKPRRRCHLTPKDWILAVLIAVIIIAVSLATGGSIRNSIHAHQQGIQEPTSPETITSTAAMTQTIQVSSVVATVTSTGKSNITSASTATATASDLGLSSRAFLETAVDEFTPKVTGAPFRGLESRSSPITLSTVTRGPFQGLESRLPWTTLAAVTKLSAQGLAKELTARLCSVVGYYKESEGIPNCESVLLVK